jgi:two-component system osmolarity sensor histidine kinase EnvZ
LLDQTLSVQLGRQIARPFWIDTVGRSNSWKSASSSTTR